MRGEIFYNVGKGKKGKGFLKRFVFSSTRGVDEF